MPDKPTFDPNKPYQEVGGSKPAFDPTKPYKEVKSNLSPLGKLNSIDKSLIDVQPNNVVDVDLKLNSYIDNLNKNSPLTNQIDDDQKKSLINYAKAGASKEDISDAIMTYQGVHPKQVDGNKYYMKEVAPSVYKPIAINNNEKPPKGYDVESIWGNQEDANNDYVVTSLAKHVWNGIVGGAEGLVSLAEAGHGLVTGEDSSGIQSLKNAAHSLKFNTKASENTPIFNGEKMKDWTDVFDPSRYDLSGDKVQGQILNGIESVISFAVGRGGGSSSKLANKALSGMSAYNLSLTDMLQAADDAGLEGRDKYAFASVASIPQALLESAFGTGGLLTKNAIAKQELKKLGTELAKNLEKNTVGELTKESLEKLQKEMTIGALAINKKFGSQVTGNLLEEGATEGLQQFAEESSKQLYDKLSEDPKFNADAFSPESLGKYVNSTIGGLMGSLGPSSVLVHQERKIAKKELESNNAYSIASKGQEAVDAFKIDVQNKVATGGLTQEQADNAIFKVEAYHEYNKLSKDLSLDDDNRRKLFDLSFQKENLKASIKEVENRDKQGHSRLDQLSPMELGLHNNKVKQAKALQEDIDLIVAKSEVLQQPEVSDSVLEKVVKEEEKAASPNEAPEGGTQSEIAKLTSFYKTIKVPASPKKVAVNEDIAETETKSEAKPATKKREVFTEVPAEKFNVKTDLEKKTIVQEHLKSTKNKAVEGTIEEGQNKKMHINLGDGKYVVLASSVEGKDGSIDIINRQNLPKTKEIGVIKDSQGQPLFSYKEPVVIQRQEVYAYDKDGKPQFNENGEHKKKAVLSVFNKETGKYIVSVREKGKIGFKAWKGSEYSPLEVEQLKKLYTNGYTGEQSALPLKQYELSTKSTSIPLTITALVRQQVYDLGYSKEDVDRMKPEKAQELITNQKTKEKAPEPKLKEPTGVIRQIKKREPLKTIKVVEAKKSENVLEEENKLKSYVSHVLQLVKNYNALSKKDKKEDKNGFVTKLYNTIQSKAKELGYEAKPINNLLTLLNDKGKQVYSESNKTTEEQKAIKEVLSKIYKSVPKTFREASLRFFLGGGKISTGDLVRGLGLGSVNGTEVKLNPKSKPEFDSRIWASKKDAMSIDNIVHDIWVQDMEMSEETFDESQMIDEFMDVLRETSGKASMIQELVEEYNNNLKKVDYASEAQMEEAREAEEAEKYVNERELTDAEIADLITEEEYRKESDAYQADKYEDLQKAKKNTEVISKFEKSVNLFYQIQDADGASKKRSIASKRRKFLEENPDIKFIDDNINYIYEQLQNKGLLIKKGNCP